MNATWFIRWERLKWWLRLGPLGDRRKRQRARLELLFTPGVDHLVQSVMDLRYGKHGWRVSDDMLEARVDQAQSYGAGRSYWGLIGPLRSINTRKWLTSVWMEHKGLSHAKPLTQERTRQPDDSPIVGQAMDILDGEPDTQPLDDSKGPSK